MAKKKIELAGTVNYDSLLVNTPLDKSFFCTDGQVFHNLEELSDSLSGMSHEAFSFHVNSAKNDFASWIYNVIGDVELANNLRKTTDKKKTIIALKKRIAEIKIKLKMI